MINSNSSKTIDFSSTVSGAKWVGIRMYSRKINNAKFGPNAEGFSISNVEFGISSLATEIDPVYGGKSEFSGIALGRISGFVQIDSSEEKIIDFSTISNMINMSNVTSIYLDKINFTMWQTIDDVNITKTVSHRVSASESLRYLLNNTATNKLSNSISFKYEDVDVVVNGLDQSNSLSVFSTAIVDSYRLNCTAAPTSISNGDFSLTQVPGRSNFYIVKTISWI